MYDNPALQAQSTAVSLNVPQTETGIERINRQLTDAERRVEELTELKKLLGDNPSIERAMTLLSRGF